MAIKSQEGEVSEIDMIKASLHGLVKAQGTDYEGDSLGNVGGGWESNPRLPGRKAWQKGK